MDTALILDGLLVVLLVATITYCALLYRRLGQLRKAQSELPRMIADFNQATERAENGIAGLKQTARETGQALQERIDSARTLVEDLRFLAEQGGRLADRLEDGIRGARANVSEPAVAPAAASSAGGSTRAAPSPSKVEGGERAPQEAKAGAKTARRAMREPSNREEAEEELLRVLREGR